jgi:Phage integrase family
MKPTALHIERWLSNVEARLVPPPLRVLQVKVYAARDKAKALALLAARAPDAFADRTVEDINWSDDLAAAQAEAVAEHIAAHPEDAGRTVKDFFELTTGRLHVRRAKNGSPSVHPMQGDEIRALRRLQREQGASSHVFMSERDGPMTPKAFHALFGRIGSRAKMQFPIHPHMLRHGCGYALANAGHDTRALQAWLGHRNIQHTVRYTELAPDRFKNFWR